MDPAINFPVILHEIERAVRERPTLWADPVIDPPDTGQIGTGKGSPNAFFIVQKRYADMPEDVLTAGLDPGYEVFGNPFLAPSPFFTTAATLPAFLFWLHNGFRIRERCITGKRCLLPYFCF